MSCVPGQVCVYRSGVHVFDIRDPAAPRQTAVIRTVMPNEPIDVTVADGYLFAVGNGGLSVHDVTDPAHPLQVDAFPGPAHVPHPEIRMDAVTVGRDAVYAPYGADIDYQGVAVVDVDGGGGER